MELKWLNREIENAMRRKIASHRRARATRNFEEYIHLCKRVKNLVRAANRAEKIRIVLSGKEIQNEFFGHVDSQKPIYVEIGALGDLDRS